MSDSLSPCDGDLAVNDGARAADHEQVLIEIDAFLRTAAVPPNLTRFITAEPRQNGSVNDGAHHPDAAELMRRAHERQPTVEHFAAATLRAALRGLLYDRWTIAVARRLAEQPREVIDAVIQQLSRFAPARCPDDVWWVWCRLAKKFPDDEAFDYSDRQIRGAWREVIADRRRGDNAGGGPEASPARQACKAALRRAAAESHRPRHQLVPLRIVDYEPLSGTLRLSPVAGDSCALSPRGRKTMNAWLAIRGAADGKLFELPVAVAYSSADCSSLRALDERRDEHAIDPAERLAEADLIEQLADGANASVAIYLREKVEVAGDWPEPLVDLLSARCSALGGPVGQAVRLTTPQRRLARARCIHRWRSLA